MTIGSHLTQFAGKQIVDYVPETGIQNPDLCYRLRTEWNDKLTWIEKFNQFIAEPLAPQVTGFVVGAWSDSWDSSSQFIVDALVAAGDRLPHLDTLFVADITYEESEISWIQQSDVSPLFAAYPGLLHFGVRGGNNLRFHHFEHHRLQTLVVQTGGLDRRVVHDIFSSHLPALTHLELWLGTEEYGATVTIEDLAPLLAAKLFPHLRYLGLRDSHVADEVAAAVALSPLLEQIDVLDLSLGILTDQGGAALLNSPSVRRLQKLDLHYHYLSDEMMAKLAALPLQVDVSDPQEGDDDGDEVWRYVSVSE